MDFKLILFCVISCLAYEAVATNVTYGNLPQESFEEVTVSISVASLSHLYVMTRGFVDIVFRPFSAIEEFIYEVITAQGNFLDTLLSQWQTLASFEVGYMTCLVAGCLFIIFVPLVGAIMCCCRTCCDNCGGEMRQSKSRANSKWRHCLCVSLLIITVFIAVPCVFVFLTNEWVTQVVRIIPQKTNESLTDVVKYLDILPTQFEYIVDQYGTLDTELRLQVNNIDQSVGVPVQTEINVAAQPVFLQLHDLSALSNSTLRQLEVLQTATDAISSGTVMIEFALEGVRSNISSALTPCPTASPASPAAADTCNDVISSLNTLTLGGNFSANSSGTINKQLDDLSAQINAINESLSFDIDGAIASAQKQIDDIPQIVKNNSEPVTSELLTALDGINSTIDTSLSSLPLEPITDLKKQINDLDNTISNAFKTYDDNWDIYRYAAGLTLGCTVAVICVFYLIGMFCGCGGFTADPSSRSCVSNCGGISIMAAVGLSFIFSWLLMILVTLSFTIGGHGERYVCQNLEPPYEGLKFADRVLDGKLDEAIQNPGANVTVYGIITSCSENESIYTTLKLENIYNITEVVNNATEQVDQLTEMAASFNETLNITIYTQDVKDALNSLKNSSLSTVNFTAYTETINQGITAVNLTAYAEFLNASADNISLVDNDAANSLRQSSYDLVLIQQTMVDPLNTYLAEMTASVAVLEVTAGSLDSTVDQTDAELQQFDTFIQENGTEIVKVEVVKFANRLGNDVTGYADWLLLQITTNFGACRPVFIVYTQVISILCDYLMDVLNGLWFSLGWVVFFLIPGAIVGMKLAKFFRRFRADDDYNDTWNEMDTFNRSNNNGVPPSSASKFRSAKIHPSQYY